MNNDKILKIFLNYANLQLESSSFNPLLNEQTAENVSKAVCKAFNETRQIKRSNIKEKVNRNLVEFVQKLCKSSNATYCEAVIKKYHKKHRKENCKYLRKRNNNSIHIFQINKKEIDKSDLEFGVAMINIYSESCKSVLNEIVLNCLHSKESEESLEFLKKIWEHSALIVNSDIYDLISVKFVHFIEEKLLNIVIKLFEIKFYDSYDTFNNILLDHFTNFSVILSRISESRAQFLHVFYILNDILIKSTFDDRVQKLISYILDEIRLKSDKKVILQLYPLEFNNLLLLLQNEPDNIVTIELLYNYILNQISELYVSDPFNFIFLMSHYPTWLKHFKNYKLQQL